MLLVREHPRAGPYNPVARSTTIERVGRMPIQHTIRCGAPFALVDRALVGIGCARARSNPDSVRIALGPVTRARP